MRQGGRPRAEDWDEYWSMPFGDSIYTHPPEKPSLMSGSVSTNGSRKRRKQRRIGFRPPMEVKHG